MNKYILSGCLLLLLGIFFGYLLFNKHGTNNIIETKIKFDTVYKEVPSEPIIIEKIVAKTQYVRDTLIVTQAFVAKADTIIQRDTIRLMYSFPENYFAMQYFPKPDTMRIPRQTIITTQQRKRTWWEIPVCVVSGAAVGWLLSK
jgi:hypothetical protein